MGRQLLLWLEQKDFSACAKPTPRSGASLTEKELEGTSGTKGRQSKGKARLARFEELNSTEYQKRNETNEFFGYSTDTSTTSAEVSNAINPTSESPAD